MKRPTHRKSYLVGVPSIPEIFLKRNEELVESLPISEMGAFEEGREEGRFAQGDRFSKLERWLVSLPNQRSC